MASAAEPVRSYDLVVVGGTPGGIACAVRAAREGLSVLLVNRHDHLGGILSSGLGVWDTQWEGKRSPIYDETRAAFFEHYRSTYGENSPQYRDALPGKTGHTNGRYEPHVAERFVTGLVAREKNITVLKSFIPVAVEQAGGLLKSVTLRAARGAEERLVQARTFADCTYEGDLAALAKVPCRVAREARAEFNEPHAGLIFMRPVMQAPDSETARLAALRDALKLRKFPGFQQLMPESTGAADPAVQACNYRTMLTTDPANRVPITKPANYDPYFLKSLEIFSGVESIPGGKFGWNRPQIVGRQTAYVEAGWDERQRIMDEHWEATMGLLYFLQNDPTVPEGVRRAWLEYGLAKDEFADNGHRPYEMYVREARRIEGRAIYTEHDATLPPGLGRAPAHADSVAMTEWYMDSHSCTPARIAGALEEGKAMLHQETFPGQIPYGCLLPREVNNLLVPVCLSATHVAWGTVRLEPVFMQLGESAGHAAALAAKGRTTVAALDPDLLVRKLAASHSTVSFFNDVDITSDAPEVAAAQYFGTKGFFASYDARLGEPLTESVKAAWQEAFANLKKGDLEPLPPAKAVDAAEAQTSPATGETRGAFLSALYARLPSLSQTPERQRPAAPTLPKGETQLFVDSVKIREKRGVTRVIHQAKKLENPVIKAEMPWEWKERDGVPDKRVNVYGTVLKDEKTGGFRIWYSDAGDVLYATSNDGVKWERPILNISGETNQTNLKLHSSSIILDPFETDPQKKYKAVGNASKGVDEAKLQRLKDKFELVDWYRDKDHRLYYSAYSADGLRWTVNPEPILLGCDTITLSQDPVTGEYLAFHKRQGDPRVVGIRQVFLSVSKDMEHWSEPQPVIVADEVDNKAAKKLKGGIYSEFYNLSAFPYAGQWLGFATHFRRVDPPSALFGNDEVNGVKRSHTGIIDVQLVHSRDGRHWHRCSDRSPVIALGPHAYDAGSIFGLCNSPVIVGDEMRIYYTAVTTPHGGLAPDRQQSVAMASWPLDRLASLRAGEKQGSVETHEFVPEGRRLFVNADIGKGRLMVEVLDASGKTLAGYESEAGAIQGENSVKLPIRWKDAAELPAGVPMRLRFHLENGDLFSYRID